MSQIHSTALVDPSAQLADDVEVGAFSIIGPKVSIDAGSRIEIRPQLILPWCSW